MSCNRMSCVPYIFLLGIEFDQTLGFEGEGPLTRITTANITGGGSLQKVFDFSAWESDIVLIQEHHYYTNKALARLEKRVLQSKYYSNSTPAIPNPNTGGTHGGLGFMWKQ